MMLTNALYIINAFPCKLFHISPYHCILIELLIFLFISSVYIKYLVHHVSNQCKLVHGNEKVYFHLH